MPTLSGPFARLAKRISRARGSVVLAVQLDGALTTLDPNGVPLRGYYWEGPVEMTDSEGNGVQTSAPMVTLCLADLPRHPRRGDKVVFDDGPMTIAAPPQSSGGGSVTCILQKA